MRKLPNGMSNYEKIIKENRIYVDKTMYIERLENLSDKTIMFLRPRKFGKTLFTSTIAYYYDITAKDKFEELFENTYIGKHPTENKNKYHILRFNFSGIDTLHIEATIQGFKTDDFKRLMSRDGKIRKWYEILKEGTETVVDRIFITGVAPITLDSTTSRFNIVNDITKDIEFNDMLGFNTNDVKYIMNELTIPKEKQKELLPIIKQNYDGYLFSDRIKENIENYKMYNSNMTLYFLNEYSRFHEVPDKLIDVNIISDYRKIEALMDLCKGMGKIEILEKIVAGQPVESELTEKFNSEVAFEEKELISLLFYLGYLTIVESGFSKIKFNIPNDIIRKIYSEYFLTYISKIAEINTSSLDTEAMAREILLEGKNK